MSSKSKLDNTKRTKEGKGGDKKIGSNFRVREERERGEREDGKRIKFKGFNF